MKKQIQIALLALAMSPLMAWAQQIFSTPDEAASALVDAVSRKDNPQLSQLFGDNWQQFLPPDGVDRDAVARFLRDWQLGHRIVIQNATAWLEVGHAGWRLPIPMEKSDKGWAFNIAAGKDEILTRTIGRNELSAIGAMHAYVDAQEDYYQLNHAWAQKIISSKGKKDGLYWPIAPGEAPSPLGPNFSPAAPNAGYHGYHFRVIEGRDNGTVALLAWPVAWGETGVMSFMVGQDDRVYQANFGEGTSEKMTAIDRFDTQTPWQPAQ
ncbi:MULTISPECIES: DUF2950 family protein [unclassified Klebsiella]|uniref:DUF2950 family protein n=1 Tax=Enterobacteriaceae TaxID=543 RepID=UPI0015DBDE28|nr:MULTISPECIES: DUF2950 family protein [unclassified Klebsiella]HAT3951691.1 DUF2950 domain-containing protein [Kluyvera ascorbata]BBR60538.1 hypothetical protein WP4W18E05_39060 [Klebsiella sp. WP4-W18-ESBL-05]BBS93239.1 hypothetical protein WP7S18C02_38540 [Klebsiella sp. WP7-S18-CRE-02]BBS98268.1 hypothetical protein WP7S18C03_38610 [Klebsiella sp. WP7-S18-CRE-03]BBT03335.1 hypothetical protein WP7S18E04_38970 [Klebsiella sp. WP7-S18-ESBL-04]